ncbi:MAG: hypothetical protein ABSC60_13050 [Acidobacteriota bacterium]
MNRALLLLNSPEPAKRAWGAYLVGQNDLSELEPRLRQLLDHMDKVGENEIRSILDAEIRLGTKLPAETVKMIYAKYPDEATVLFSRSPIGYAEVILPFFKEEPIISTRWTRWLALGDLLSEAKYPEFAKLLMRQMSNLNLFVSVVDPHSGGGIGGGCGTGGRVIKVPGEFPPVAVYELRQYPERGALVLAPRPRPVYALRKLIAPGEGISVFDEFSCRDPDLVPVRQEFLSSMLDVRLAEIQFDTGISIKWSDSKHFSKKVRTYCQEVLNKYEHIKSLLMDKKLISLSDAQALEAHLFLRVEDFRKNKTHPIPEIHLDRVTVEK